MRKRGQTKFTRDINSCLCHLDGMNVRHDLLLVVLRPTKNQDIITTFYSETGMPMIPTLHRVTTKIVRHLSSQVYRFVPT